MASTYVNDLRLNEMATGDESGNWGVVTNLNLELIGEALSFGTEAITTNADTHTTTVADGAADPGRAMYLKYTGTLDSACTITIAPNTISRMHFIENGTSGSQNIIISQGSGANITIPAGDTKAVYLDGAGSGAAVVDAFASLSTVDLKVQDDLTVTDDATIGGTLGVTGIVTLTDDLIIGDGKTIGSASDVDAITIAANGQLTLTQTLIGTALDISGDIDVDGTSNLDVVDIDGAVDMASTLQVDGAITSSAGATITVADNSENLVLKSTDADANVGPQLTLWRASGSPADNDAIGQISFNANDDGANVTNFATIAGFIDDASNGSEDGIIHINSIVAGSLVNRMSVLPAATVFNEGSIDVDFRVESDNDANAFFLQGNTGNIALGHNAPDQMLHLKDSADTYIVLEAGASDGNGGILFHNSSGTEVGTQLFDTDDHYMRFLVSTAQGNAFVANTVSTWRAMEIFQQRGVTNSASGIAFRGESGTAPAGIVSLAGNTTGGIEGLVFLVSNSNTTSERMRIESEGTVCMGRTDDMFNATLSVNSAQAGGIAIGESEGTNAARHIYFMDNTGILRFASTGNIATLSNAGAWTNASDIAYKNNIVDTEYGLETIKQLKPRDYKLKDTGDSDTGFIAQEIETVLPQFVEGDDGAKTLNYSQLTAVLTKALQELETRVTTLEG